jgi:uncharacterized protein
MHSGACIINSMKRAYFRFHRELEELLPPEKRGEAFSYDFNGSQSIKHLIESLGVPHTEIGAMTVNKKPVDTSYQVQDGDWVEVQPARCESLKGEPKFILDNHLGKLAGYLRMLGFDTLYRNNYDDTELAEIAAREGRTLLTRDRRLLMRKQVQAGYCVRKHDPQEQLKDVLKRFALYERLHPFKRCMSCNTLLEEALKEQILDRLEPLTKQYFDTFSLCPGCRKVYWPGSHYDHMQDMIQKILEDEDQ